jgi:hypothetical protein
MYIAESDPTSFEMALSVEDDLKLPLSMHWIAIAVAMPVSKN